MTAAGRAGLSVQAAVPSTFMRFPSRAYSRSPLGDWPGVRQGGCQHEDRLGGSAGQPEAPSWLAPRGSNRCRCDFGAKSKAGWVLVLRWRIAAILLAAISELEEVS